MSEVSHYINKIARVVSLMRRSGNYTATLISGVWNISSDTKHLLAVKDYVYIGTVKARVTEVVDYLTFRIETFGLVVSGTGVWYAASPYFDYGTRKTINRALLDKNNGEYNYQKYPLVALRLPVVLDTVNSITTADINVLIATFTRKQYRPQERMANVFNPILYPLVRQFLNMLRLSGEFLSFDADYQQIDRMFYGTESGDEQNIANVFDDPLDAVEIRNLKLKFIADDCPTFEPLVEPFGGFQYAMEKTFES